jgi:hypothetical protein
MVSIQDKGHPNLLQTIAFSSLPARGTIADSVENMDISAIPCYYVHVMSTKRPLETILKPAPIPG